MPVKIITAVVGQMKTNCYLIIDDEANNAIIVDPGDDADYLQNIINENRSALSAIVLTHGHFDHAMAALELKLNFKIPVLMNPKDNFLLSNMSKSAKYYLGCESGPAPEIDRNLKEGSIIKFGKTKLLCLETPGHTPGSISLYNKENNVIFTGDTIFGRGAVGRTDFHYSSEKDLEASLKKILELPENTIIYPGHGEHSTIMVESKIHNII